MEKNKKLEEIELELKDKLNNKLENKNLTLNYFSIDFENYLHLQIAPQNYGTTLDIVYNLNSYLEDEEINEDKILNGIINKINNLLSDEYEVPILILQRYYKVFEDLTFEEIKEIIEKAEYLKEAWLSVTL